MKKVFTVYGSEDGILGVAGNKKKVYECAKKYLTGKGSSQEGETMNVTYNQFCKQMNYYFTFHTKEQPNDGMTVSVELFQLNNL